MFLPRAAVVTPLRRVVTSRILIFAALSRGSAIFVVEAHIGVS